MKSWQEWVNNISDWVREHPSASRWVAGAGVVVVLLALFGNYSFFGDPTISLFDSRQLTTDEIGLMQVAFGKSGLNEYEIRGTQVEVPKSRRAEYLKALSDHGAIPQDLTAHLESPSSFDFFQTRAQQRSWQLARKKQTIRDMVMQLRFVDRAIVDYDETRGATPFEDMQRTAVVNVTPQLNRVLTLSEVKAIRDTVRGAVAGLRSEDITIIDTFASKSHTGIGATETEDLQPHTITKMQAERKYENKIRSALTAYPGIRVNVEVGIDPVVRRIRDERNLEGEPRIVERTIQRETSARVPAASPSFIQSVFDLGANRQARVAATQKPLERSTETTQSMTNGTFQTTEMAGPMVTHVNVSIGIPERCVQYFVDQNTFGRQPDTNEIRRQKEQVFEQLQLDIRQKVGPLVPGVGGIQNDLQRIVVTLDREIPLNSGPTTQTAGATGLGWHWSWIGLAAGGLLALLFFRTEGRTRVPETVSTDVVSYSENQAESRSPVMAEEFDSRPVAGNASTVTMDGVLSDSPETAGDASSLDFDTQQKIRVQLDQWCRENPAAAAATIRQWLERKAG